MTMFAHDDTSIAGVQVVTRKRQSDSRGYLERLFEPDVLGELGAQSTVEQVNHTVTKHAGTVRGFHLQLPPHAETKLVSCLRGSILDVAVDLRPESPTFLRWFGCELSAANGKSLLIPPGCAHGVQTLENDCELLYLHTAPYVRKSEAGISPMSPLIAVNWPLPISFISERDLRESSDISKFQGVNW